MAAGCSARAWPLLLVLLRGAAAMLAVQPQDSMVAETLQALDTDHSGKVELEEIVAFAQSQGADVAKTIDDFHELDRDNSGSLDLEELGNSIEFGGSPAAVASPADAITQQISAPAAPAVAAPAAAATPEESDALASIQDQPQQAAAFPENPVAEPVAEQAMPVQAAQAAPVQAAPVAQPATIQAAKELSATALLETSIANAQRFAAKASAEVFSQRAEDLMARQEADEAKAKDLESLSVKLRQNATALLASAVEESRRATKAAVEGVVKKAMEDVQKLEREAADKDKEAQEELQKSEEAAGKVAKAQAELSESVKRLRSRFSTETR